MPAKKHNFTVVEIKAGVMVIASTAVLILFVMVMTGLRPPENTLTFHAHFKDTAGLNRGADVRFGGAKVGRVTDITLEKADQSLVRVVVTVKPGTPINAKSKASVSQTTLTAEKHFEISTGDKDAQLLPDGAEIATQAGGLFDQAGAVAGTVQDILKDVSELLGVGQAKEREAEGEGALVTVADITESVGDVTKKGSGLVQDVRDVIGENRDEFASILAKAQEIGASAKDLVTSIQDVLAENRPDIRATVESVRALAGRVGEVSEQLDGLVKAIQSTLDNAESLSAGAQHMIEANRPVIEDTLLDLRETVRQLKTFARTMAEQPDAVIRGKASEGRR